MCTWGKPGSPAANLISTKSVWVSVSSMCTYCRKAASEGWMALAAAARAAWYVVSCACRFMSTCAMSASSTFDRFCFMVRRVRRVLVLGGVDARVGRTDRRLRGLDWSASASCSCALSAVERLIAVDRVGELRERREDVVAGRAEHALSPLTFTWTCTPGAIVRCTARRRTDVVARRVVRRRLPEVVPPNSGRLSYCVFASPIRLWRIWSIWFAMRVA